MVKKDFPLFTLERILKKAGAERISLSAAEELRTLLLEITDKIAKDAIALATHAKRTTVKKEDIKLAIR
ncbi:MAG: NFYB/HAP3 family transcription factor subunit [Candidatus Aenigmarchaeota archaeon]|nr:NFYB/HAP3 family transcription factor subunit [Candidatus Aenigmarchaeota archaeon]